MSDSIHRYRTAPTVSATVPSSAAANTIEDQRCILSKILGQPATEFLADDDNVRHFTAYLDCAGIQLSDATEVEAFFHEFIACLHPQGALDGQRILALLNRPTGGGTTFFSSAIAGYKVPILQDLFVMSGLKKPSEDDLQLFLTYFKAYGPSPLESLQVFRFMNGWSSAIDLENSLQNRLKNLKRCVNSLGASKFDAAIRSGDLGRVKAMLALGSNAARKGERGPLGLALRCDRHVRAQMVSLLLSAGADPNASVQFGGKPIRIAVRERDLDCAQVLLEHGANPNLGFPLQIAISLKDGAMAELLIGHGASIEDLFTIDRQNLAEIRRLHDLAEAALQADDEEALNQCIKNIQVLLGPGAADGFLEGLADRMAVQADAHREYLEGWFKDQGLAIAGAALDDFRIVPGTDPTMRYDSSVHALRAIELAGAWAFDRHAPFGRALAILRYVSAQSMQQGASPQLVEELRSACREIISQLDSSALPELHQRAAEIEVFLDKGAFTSRQ
jgi:hypothetical protein